MPTLTFTDAELAIVKQAVECHNDMTNDMVFDELSTSLFPKADEPVVMNQAQAKVLRDELNAAITKIATLRSAMTKLGIKVNEVGFSV